MSNYRRLYQEGGCYFFTLVTHQRQAIFNTEKAINTLKISLKKAQNKHPFKIIAIVILGDHLHCILQLPKDDDNFSTRLRLIKTHFTKLQPDKKQKVWQSRFWEHLIRDEKDFFKHIDYIHYNPVKHHYVKNVKDWHYSSFHYFVQQGWYDKNWGSNEPSSIRDLYLE